MSQKYRIAHFDEIPSPSPRREGSSHWRPVRHHLNIAAFGINGFVAEDVGDQLVPEHTEVQDGCKSHEELYLVLEGAVSFKVDGEDVELTKGAMLFISDPAAVRSARAKEPGSAILAIGAPRGRGFEVASWESKHF